MPIWTSDRVLLRPACLLGAIALLSGCVTGPAGQLVPPTGQRGLLASARGAEALGDTQSVTTLPVVGGEVVLSAPADYCIDLETVENKRTRAFAVIASCQILRGDPAGSGVPPVIVTVTVGGKDPGAQVPSPEQIAASAGGGLLRRAAQNGVSVVQLAKGGNQVLEGGDQRYWRGAFVIGGRQVGLALYAPQGSTMASANGGAFLQATAKAIRTASPEAERASQQQALPIGTDEANATSAPGRVAVLRKAGEADKAVAEDSAGSPPRQEGLGAATGSLFKGNALR